MCYIYLCLFYELMRSFMASVIFKLLFCSIFTSDGVKMM